MIKRILFLFIALFVPLAAFADAPITQWSTYTGNNKLEWFDSLDATCTPYAAYATLNSTNSEATFRCGGVSSPNIYLDKMCLKAGCSGGALNTWIPKYITATPGTRKWCKSGVAPDLNKPLAEQCPSACPPGASYPVTQDLGTDFDKAANAPYPTCSAGCGVSTKSLDGCWKYSATGVYRCDFTVSNTGSACSVSDVGTAQPRPTADQATPVTSAPQKAPNAVDCPKGTTQAGMSSDGVPLCVGTGTKPSTDTASTSKTGPEQVTTNPDGSTVKTQSTDVTNPDGSVTTTTKTTTTAADGTVTVKVTSSTGNTPTGAAGKPAANGADGKDAKNICQTNPELTMCKNSTVSGDCDAGYSCTGDAIQCATMQAARAMQCKQKKDEDELKGSSFYSSAKAIADGNDPLKSSLPGVGNAESVQMKTPEATGWLGGGSYFKDKTIDLGDGHSLVLPLSKAENLMLALRYVTMIVASLVCFKIIRGTFAGSEI